MAFTREERYRPYKDWTKEQIAKIEENVAKSPWHTHFHIEPDRGLLNDPNGFSYFDGKWELFYQHFPFGAAHGLKSWTQLESEDLVHFKPTGLTLLPDTPLDSHGMYSGSAMQVDDKLFVFYTGNVRDKDWIRQTYQNGGFLDKNNHFTKLDQTLIDQPDDVSEHFRDPQIFKYQGQFYTIVGAQSLDKKGFIKLYKAVDNDVTKWDEIGNLDFGGKGSEYMEECPNLVFVDNHPVLLYCPQGLDKKELDYQNIYPNTFKIYDEFIPETGQLTNGSPIQNLDYGFECYATQAFNAPDGRVLAVSWLGLPDVEYPSDRYDYQGTLSLVKELTIKNGRLYQKPVDAITSLRVRKEAFAPKEETNNTYELELNFEQDSQTELVLFADQNGDGLTLNFDIKNGTITIDRSKAGEQYALDFGTVRSCTIDNAKTSARIFIDRSVFEIFINDGEKVFSGRVYPKDKQNGIHLTKGNAHGNFYTLDYDSKTK